MRCFLGQTPTSPGTLSGLKDGQSQPQGLHSKLEKQGLTPGSSGVGVRIQHTSQKTLCTSPWIVRLGQVKGR